MCKSWKVFDVRGRDDHMLIHEGALVSMLSQEKAIGQSVTGIGSTLVSTVVWERLAKSLPSLATALATISAVDKDGKYLRPD